MAAEIVISDVQPVGEPAIDLPAAVPDENGAPLEEIFRQHHPRMVGLLTRITGDRGHAEDIAGDVFCKLARGRGLFGGRGDLTAWLYRVAINAGFDSLRAAARRRRREESAGVETLRVVEPSGALDDMLREERRTRVRAVLADLKPRETQLLLLRSSGLAYREIAQTLGVAPGSVGTLLARAEAEFERKYRARHGDAR